MSTFADSGARAEQVAVTTIYQSDQTLMVPETKQARSPGDGAAGVAQSALDQSLLDLEYFTLKRESIPRAFFDLRFLLLGRHQSVDNSECRVNQPFRSCWILRITKQRHGSFIFGHEFFRRSLTGKFLNDADPRARSAFTVAGNLRNLHRSLQ